MAKKLDSEPAVFFVSTPFHLILSTILALEEKKERTCILIFIDQPIDHKNIYFDVMMNIKCSPFKYCYQFNSISSSSLKKFSYRRKVLKKIKDLIADIKPGAIYTGNDRRIEFIRGYTQMKSQNYNSKIIYVDDGVLSYVIHKHAYESIVEISLKKLYYGFWYKRQQVVGGLDSIDKAYLAFPEYAHHKLKEKKLNPIKKDAFFSIELELIINDIFNCFDYKKNEISQIDLIHILPHRKELKQFKSFYEKLIMSISKIASDHFNVAVKHHPLEKDNLYSNLNSKVKTIPADLAFEYIVPILKKGAIIVGDVSTVLLTTKWIRPDLNVISIKNELDPRQKIISSLAKYLNIKNFENIDSFIKNHFIETNKW